MTDITPTTPIRELIGVGPVLAECFTRIGVATVEDLLEWIPFRVEDRSQLSTIQSLPFNQSKVIKGKVLRASTRKSKRGITIVQATIEDQTGKIDALWFNQRYILKMLRPEQEVLLYGERRFSKPLGNPFFVKAIIEKPEILPVYHTTKGLTQFALRRLLGGVLPLISSLPEILPTEIQQELSLPNKAKTLLECHSRPNVEVLQKAKQILSAEELLILALSIYQTKTKQNLRAIRTFTVDTESLKNFTDNLPFHLTMEQRQIAWEIIQRMSQGKVLNHLLYGEVGSGKTMVALLCALPILHNKQRVVLLCPTTTLANQHYQTAVKYLSPFDIKVALLTGSQKDSHQNAELIIGTQALLQQAITIENLGLLIIDEQHRFGVKERQHLLKTNEQAHLLMMTATPIPRSLAHTLFGHLTISYLHEKPSQQKPVKTVVFTDNERTKIEEYIAERIRNGEPGYIICPLISSSEESEELPQLFQNERKAIATERKRLESVFPKARIGVLHGRLKSADKDKVMKEFKEGALDILLSTTVVEVGIDNPNATWVLVEEADRFGLSQLHQLRGRVGRGNKASVCFFANSQTTEKSQERLRIISQSSDGLELSEKDLAMRGPGELIGSEQSGLPALKYADWSDTDNFQKVFTAAEKLLKIGLDKYPQLDQKVEEFKNSRDQLSTA